MTPRGSTQIPPAVKDTKTADAENDPIPHRIIIEKQKNPQRKSSVNCFY